jgi:hypothetical protein
MSTEIPVQKISAAQARELLPDLEASGLPVAEFARQRNVDRVPLYNARRASRVAASKTSRERFAKVTVLDRESAPEASSPSIVIELPNRLRLQVPFGFDDVSLRRVLEVVKTC